LPDRPTVGNELRRKGVTLQLVWLQYRATHPDGYGRSWFCELYHSCEWRPPPNMFTGLIAPLLMGSRQLAAEVAIGAAIAGVGEVPAGALADAAAPHDRDPASESDVCSASTARLKTCAASCGICSPRWATR